MARLLILLGMIGAAAAAAVVVYQSRSAPEAPEPVAVPAPVEEETETVATVAPEVEPEPEAPALPAPPRIDLLRVEPTGQAIVAGRGAPGWEVDILLDAAVLVAVEPDGEGAFTTFLDIPPSEVPRTLSLLMRLDDEKIPSEDVMIIAPATVLVAEPEPAPAPDPQPAPETVVSEEEAETPVEDPAPETDVAEAPADPIETPKTEETPASDVATVVEEDVVEEAPVTVAEAPAPVEEITPAVDTEEVAALAAPELVAPAPSEPAPTTPQPVAETPSVVQEETVAEADTQTEPVVQEAPEVVADDPAPLEDETPTVAAVEDDTTTPEPVDTPAPVAVAEDTADSATPEEEVETTAALEVPQAPVVLRADAEGLTVLQAPDLTDDIALDSISYDAAGEVSLAGRGSSEFVRIYLDNTPVTTSRIEADGSWQAELPEVDRGVYTLRVDAVEADGRVSSRVETPFLREDRESLAAADAQAAEENTPPARVVTVQPGNTLWALARDRYGEGTLYVRIFQANRERIRDPDLIYPGQVFDLPE